MLQAARSTSVIICAYTEDRWQDLKLAVESVRGQTQSPDEIIVVIDHNARLFKRAQAELSGVLVIENHLAKGLSGARNSGAEAAQGAIIAFLDDDAVADARWIEALTACYTGPHIAGVGGKIEPRWLEQRPAWFPAEFNWVVGCSYRGMPTQNAAVRNIIGANMSMRRQVLLASGGFRESFGCNHADDDRGTQDSKWLRHHAGDEETDLCMRATQHSPGNIWLYTPDAPVYHRVSVQRTRLSYYLWRCYDEGLGKAILVELHGAKAGLSSEQAYTFKVLPAGIIRGLRDALWHRDPSGLGRAGAIVGGLAATTIGYCIGTFSRCFGLMISSLRLVSYPERHVHQGDQWEGRR